MMCLSASLQLPKQSRHDITSNTSHTSLPYVDGKQAGAIVYVLPALSRMTLALAVIDMRFAWAQQKIEQIIEGALDTTCSKFCNAYCLQDIHSNCSRMNTENLSVAQGSFVEAARPSLQMIQISATILELIRAPAVHDHSQAYVRRCALLTVSKVQKLVIIY